MKKKLFLLVGQSGSGKDSLANMLKQDGYNVLKSYTTRPRRDNEVDTHIFINKADVSKYKDDIIAYTKIGEYEYFATKTQLLENDIYIIDPNGVDYLKSKNSDIHIVTIYINVPECERRFRILNIRKDNPDEMVKRFINENSQFDKFRAKADFDYSIPNTDIEKSYKVLRSIIEIELN